MRTSSRAALFAATVTVTPWASAFVSIRGAGAAYAGGAVAQKPAPALLVLMAWARSTTVTPAGGVLCLAGVAVSRRRAVRPVVRGAV